MNAKDTFLAANAHVDEAAVQPLPNSRKVYIEGSRPDIQVPMREISQADTDTAFGGEKNPPVYRVRLFRPLFRPGRQDRYP
jgi:phosphomethylpyrimidine synthase